MRKPKPPPPVIEELVAAIERTTPSYYISEHERWVDDEAILNITARIEAIGKKHKHLIGSTLDLSLTCSRRFDRDEGETTGGRPWLHGLRLTKDGCFAGASLHADVFWALRSMITAGQINHVNLRYQNPRYGSAALLSIAFDPPSMN